MDESRSQKPFGWSHFPVTALVARLLCRELIQENEYPRTENRILRAKLPRRIAFADEERRSLLDVAREMDRRSSLGCSCTTTTHVSVRPSMPSCVTQV